MTNDQRQTVSEKVTQKGKGMDNDLFTGKLVRLTAFNSEADVEIMARWSRDTEYHRLGDNDPAYPLSGTRQENGWSMTARAVSVL